MNYEDFEANAWDREVESKLEKGLRQDARSWSAEPPLGSLETFRARLADVQPERVRSRAGLPLAAAALLVLGLSFWVLGGSPGTEPDAAVESTGEDALVGSLQRELAAVTADANAIAATLMAPFSGRVFGMLAEGG